MKSLILLLLLAPFGLFGMNATPPDSSTHLLKKTEAMFIMDKGKELFNQGATRAALNKFREAHAIDQNSANALYWIGRCQYELNNYGIALKYGTMAYKQDSSGIDHEVYHMLGETYHRLANFDSALYFLNLAKLKIAKNHAKDLMLDMKIAQINFAKEELSKGHLSKLVSVSEKINTGYQEYGALVNHTCDTLYFTSKRSDTKGGGINPDDQEYYEDIYMAVKINGVWDSVTNVLGRLNTDGFDAMTYISPKSDMALMTINTTYMENPSPKTKGSDIFEIVKSNKGKWSSPKAISNKSINTSFFEGGATITADGNTMYFVSDRKGEKSSTDLYVVQKNGKSWGEAKALPMTINTIGRETTPFITPDGRYLFFSSDGHPGMGGYDIFVVENLGDSWGTPINLGATINTVNNDTHFQYFMDLKKAFMSSVHIDGQKSSYNIYEIDMNGFEMPK